MSAKPRRWVLEPYRGMSNQPSVQKGPDVSAPERVMPVSEHEADLAALREAAQAVDETSNHIVLTGRSAESVTAAQLALQNLRAVLASADSGTVASGL